MISTGAALIRNKKILLLKRSISSKGFPGCWCMPGGKPDSNESNEQAIMREIKEETNYDFIPSECFLIIKDTMDSHNFLGSFSGRFKISNEHEDHGWFSSKELIALKLTPHTKKCINVLKTRELL